MLTELDEAKQAVAVAEAKFNVVDPEFLDAVSLELTAAERRFNGLFKKIREVS